MKSMSGCYTKDILREVENVVQTKAGGNPAAFDHVLIVMPTLNELCATAGTAIKKGNPDHLGVFKKLGETLAPMRYKMVIGPGSETTWGIKGNLSFDQMTAELYQEFSNNDIPVCSGMPLFRQLEKKDQFHFQTCDKKPKDIPSVLSGLNRTNNVNSNTSKRITLSTGTAGIRKENQENWGRLYSSRPQEPNGIDSTLSQRRNRKLHENA